MAQAEGLSSMVTTHPIDAEIRRTAPPVARTPPVGGAQATGHTAGAAWKGGTPFKRRLKAGKAKSGGVLAPNTGSGRGRAKEGLWKEDRPLCGGEP